MVLAIITGLVGPPLLFGAFHLVRENGWKMGYFVLTMVGGMSSLFGVASTYRFFRPLTTVSEITAAPITCRLNGVVKYEIRRQDIEAVEVSVGPIDYIHVHWKNGRRTGIRPWYFWDFDLLREHLRACDYSVIES